jgi:hypothetical protein
LERLVVTEELQHLKAKDTITLNKEGRSAYWNTWKQENYDLLVNQLGYKTTIAHFLHGLFFAPSFSKATVPKLQTVFMADACHLNFEKYTMFSCYGVTANANMSPVGFAIVFGNENASSWKDFWHFILPTHPSNDRGDVTMISDQDKVIKSTIEEERQLVGHFFCSWHQRKNIIVQCGGAGGRVPYSALWTFNKLSDCRSVKQWERERDQYFPHMHQKDIQYLNSVPDASQYAVKRCKESENIYMFHRTMLQGSDSMNVVNREICSRLVVCPVNATMLCLKAECNRFQSQQLATWSNSNELTPRGEQEHKEVFDGINYRDFTINLQDRGNDCWEFSVLRNIAGGRMSNLVTIPKVPMKGSYFGRCTCGLTQCNAIPCEHTAAVVVSSQIPALT